MIPPGRFVVFVQILDTLCNMLNSTLGIESKSRISSVFCKAPPNSIFSPLSIYRDALLLADINRLSSC